MRGKRAGKEAEERGGGAKAAWRTLPVGKQ